MNILLLTPGTGNFHCGSCLRDHTLVRALRAAGHEAHLVPMYLPQVFDEPVDDATDGAVFFGGLNVYLQQKSGLFRHTPRWLDRVLDAPGLLRKSADLAGMTRASDLAEVTLSMLRGEHGRQTKELDRLVAWIKQTQHPDVICLNNALLLGLARRLKDELNVPIVCTLHGEDEFIDTLPQPMRDRTWDELSARAGHVDALIAVSDYYGGVMRSRARLDGERLHVVHNGVPVRGLEPSPRRPTQPTIGYLARLRPDKGLGALAEAFILLKRRDAARDVQLCVVGSETPADRAFVKSIKARLVQAGVADDAHWHTNVTRGRKAELLRSMSVLSVPATYGEAFGLYLLEAWACGVPVVQPRSGAFPELLGLTRAGILCEPDDPAALADALADVLTNPDEAAEMGRRGRQAVLERFTDEHMADGLINILQRVTRTGSPSHGV